MLSYISKLPTIDAPPLPRKLVILGSTGSIGVSGLKVAARHPDKLTVLALAGGRNGAKLAEQAAEFRPPYLAVLDDAAATELKTRLSELAAGYEPEILVGPQAYVDLAMLDDADMVLSAIVGAAGLPPTLAAAQSGKVIALANKESLVCAGGLIRRECARTGAMLLPVDSEHNALFQAVRGEDAKSVRRLILTASGGPFRGKDLDFLASVTRDQALKHPNWSMGAKISIDSATLMNKGLEFIEACQLFGCGDDCVEVVVHPQSIVHSLAEFEDGSLLAQLGPTDMQIAIAYALAFPQRVETGLEPLDLVKVAQLTFEAPDETAFPCLRLAKEAFAASESHPVVLNAANEVAVDAFLKERIAFLDIPRFIEAELEAHAGRTLETAEAVLALDGDIRARLAVRCASTNTGSRAGGAPCS